MSLLLDKPELWRKRAEEVCVIAAGMRNSETKRIMKDLANSYEGFAERAQRWARKSD
jgi:hypothetical protein